MTERDRLFDSLADLGGYLFRVTDNGGETADRYALHLSDGTFVSLSEHPDHPRGVASSGTFDPAVVHERVRAGKDLDIGVADLPECVAKTALGLINASFSIFVRDRGRDEILRSLPDRDELSGPGFQSGLDPFRAVGERSP